MASILFDATLFQFRHNLAPICVCFPQRLMAKTHRHNWPAEKGHGKIGKIEIEIAALMAAKVKQTLLQPDTQLR